MGQNVAATVPSTISIGASLVALGDVLTIALFAEMVEERSKTESGREDDGIREHVEAIASQAISNMIEQYPWNTHLVVGLQAVEITLGNEHVCCRLLKQSILAKVPQQVDPEVSTLFLLGAISFRDSCKHSICHFSRVR